MRQPLDRTEAFLWVRKKSGCGVGVRFSQSLRCTALVLEWRSGLPGPAAPVASQPPLLGRDVALSSGSRRQRAPRGGAAGANRGLLVRGLLSSAGRPSPSPFARRGCSIIARQGWCGLPSRAKKPESLRSHRFADGRRGGLALGPPLHQSSGFGRCCRVWSNNRMQLAARSFGSTPAACRRPFELRARLGSFASGRRAVYGWCTAGGS